MLYHILYLQNTKTKLLLDQIATGFIEIYYNNLLVIGGIGMCGRKQERERRELLLSSYLLYSACILLQFCSWKKKFRGRKEN